MKRVGRNEPLFMALAVATVIITSSALAQTNNTTQLQPVEVKEKRVPAPAQDSYVAPGVTTATRTDTPIAETPASIQVIPLQVIEDQGVNRLRDVYRNVSGVMPVKSEGSGIQFETAYVRGFSQRMYVDGVNFYTCPPINLAGVQQVEVLKGPASSLYGAMEVGGLINTVPRLPEFADRTTVTGEFGSYNFYRGQIDSTGGINQDMAYRVEGAYENSDSFRDFLHKESTFIAPSFTWNLSEQTRLTTWLWYQHLDRPVDNGCPFTFTGQPVGSITRNLAGPNTDNNQTIDDTVFGIRLNHDVTPDFTLREKFLMHYFDSTMDAIRFGTVNAANRLSPYYDGSSFNDLEFDLVSDALWRLELGPTKHQLLFGVELSRSDYYYDRLTDSTLAKINIFNPVYPTGPFHPVPGVAQQNTLTQGVGGFVQEQMDALDNRLHLLIGGRADYVDQFYKSWSNGLIYDQDDVGLSGRVGLMYDLTPWMSPYVNISRSFNPNTAGSSLTYDGHPLDPTTGLQYEAGSKFSFFDKRLLLTMAAYQITKENVAVNDTDHPGFSLNGGQLRSQGIEFDVLGQITPELQAVGCYAYTDTEVIESNTLPVGAPFADIPLHSGSLWLKYTFQTGWLKNFGVGAGAFACGERSGNNNHTYNVSGYARMDTAAWYSYTLRSGQQIKLQVNVFNLLDKTYYESGVAQPGTPLSVMGRVSVTF